MNISLLVGKRRNLALVLGDFDNGSEISTVDSAIKVKVANDASYN